MFDRNSRGWCEWLFGATSLCWLVCLSDATHYLPNGVDAGRERMSRQSDANNDSQDYDPKTPLLLTPLIEDGQMVRARTWSRVYGVPGMNRTSYSGFLTARPADEANFFFWFFPADVDSESTPVLLWLNGGPGSSSLGGLFGENGPYMVTPDLKLKDRRYHWATVFNMLYVDCPVGTGFSYARSTDYYSNNTEAIGQDLYRVITQFFTLFDSYASNDFYIVGESFGAKYASHLAMNIHTRNGNATQKINLKGVVTVAGFLDITGVVNRTVEYLYTVGLFDPEDYEAAKAVNENFTTALKNGNNEEAADILLPFMVATAAVSGRSFVTNATGITTGENMLLTVDPRVFLDFQQFVQKPEVRLAIHVGNRTFSQYTDDVIEPLTSDYVSSILDILENLLDAGYKVLVMSGNLDLFMTPLSYRAQALSLEWKHAVHFRNSSRIAWKVDPDDVNIAGYSNCAFNFCLVVVRNAGHRMPNDQVRATLDAVRRFAFDIPFE